MKGAGEHMHDIFSVVIRNAGRGGTQPALGSTCCSSGLRVVGNQRLFFQPNTLRVFTNDQFRGIIPSLQRG